MVSRIVFGILCPIFLLSLMAFTQELPNPKNGGIGGKSLAVLFLSPSPELDTAYAQELSQAGYSYTTACYYDELTYNFIKKFDTIVIDKLPLAAEEQRYNGQNMVGYRANIAQVWRCAEEGAGVLVYTNLADMGGACRGGWNDEMRRWGIQLYQACIVDPAGEFEKWRGMCPGAYSWTENLARHPVTDGLHRIYYASTNLRWDDCFTAPPLLCDEQWTPLVKAMAGARVAISVDREWAFEPDWQDQLVLSAVRPIGKGRLGVVSINPTYLHRMGYARVEKRWVGEMSYGLIDGIILTKGNGITPSDTGAFISHLYCWLGAHAAANGHGGYQHGQPLEKVPVTITDAEKQYRQPADFDTLPMLPSWKHRVGSVVVDGKTSSLQVPDPFVPGDIRFFKALVGVHSSYSDGNGSVEAYAAEAKKAGYALVVFTENFEQLSADEWLRLVAQCEKASSADFVCLPGYDIMDPDGNHFLIVAPPEYPRPSWLTPDGKRLAKPQMINLPLFNHLVIAHKAESGPLPQERLKHFHGLSVYTYRGTQVVDESFPAYAWQVETWSNPHPVVVHEVFTPAEVAIAARTGYQQFMPSDTVQHAVAYFRAGHWHYFESPVRFFISEGPIVDTWTMNSPAIGPAALNRRHARLDIGVHSDVPLKEVTLYDGTRMVRRWLPRVKNFTVRADFQHARQYGLFLVAEDEQGRRAITSAIRTVPERRHQRCSDRQNWLGDVGAYYTGTYLPDRVDIRLPIKGTVEGSSIFTTVRGTCMANKLNFPFTSNDVVLTESILDEKYVDALHEDVCFDAKPSKASKPSTVYAATSRRYSFTPGKPDQPYPTLVEFNIGLKRNVEPVHPAGLFPSFGSLRGTKYAWRDAAGTIITGEIGKDDVFDVPVGGMAGGFIALSEGLRVNHGEFGLAPAKGMPRAYPSGTRFQARFLLLAGPSSDNTAPPQWDRDPRRWMQAMGFAGQTPYTLTFSRGKLLDVSYLATITTDRNGAAGAVTKTADIPYLVPLALQGVNERWPAGIWREGGQLDYTGVFEGQAWPRLDVARAGKFFAGNLLTASDPRLVLEIVKWDAAAIKIEAHNPTDTSIEATIATPTEITGLKAYTRKVVIPAGSTIYLEN